MPKQQLNERVSFALILMPCCGTQLCYVNTRLPTYCSECGEKVFARIKESILFRDENAFLKYTVPDGLDVLEARISAMIEARSQPKHEVPSRPER